MLRKIDLEVNRDVVDKNINYLKCKDIVFPTFNQMKNPHTIPEKIRTKLKKVSLNNLSPYNLFRICWKNQARDNGGLYQDLPNYMELPSELTGVKARIIAMTGKYFPTGAHKVGASFACLIPKIMTGQFDLQKDSAVWPSTGNFCRGGAFNSFLVGCKSIAILPEHMSGERLEWLHNIAGEIIITSGSESNVKEIYDKVWELKQSRENIVVFNQFSEPGNHLWHYEVTGNAMNDIVKKELGNCGRLAGICLSSGSSGILGSADLLKEKYPQTKLAVSEPIQCPTLLSNGFGDHRIEGVGDKHVPWIHNVKNTDMIIGIDDYDSLNLFRLFNENIGQAYLRNIGISEAIINRLNWVGISGAANIISAIKYSKYYELGCNDIVITVLTDSSEMYQSRLREMTTKKGRNYTLADAAIDFNRSILGIKIDSVEELTYYRKKSIHNLKYFTWIEQQKFNGDELNAQWYDYDNYWGHFHGMANSIDLLINEFNDRLTHHY